MSEFVPVSTVIDFYTLDECEVLLGYLEGFEGVRQPGSTASRSFHHGWRNGLVDAGLVEADEAQIQLKSELGGEPLSCSSPHSKLH